MASLLLSARAERSPPRPDQGSTAAAALVVGGQKVEAIASTLQACSYEGKPGRGRSGVAFTGTAPQRMPGRGQEASWDYTGLPANFVVAAGPVPTTPPPLIVLDQNRIPRRVIAFNPAIHGARRWQKVGGDPWGPISIDGARDRASSVGSHDRARRQPPRDRAGGRQVLRLRPGQDGRAAQPPPPR
jgi:hypothetical protein